MRFLYLKGIEVLGPLEAKQLVQESWFSDDLLVCPEDKAEQETAWKSAKEYPEFKASLEQEIFPAQEDKEKIKPTVTAQRTPINPVASVTEERKETAPKKKTQDLPPLEDTETESATELRKREESKLIHEIVEETFPKVHNPPVILSAEPQDHTFRIPQEGDDNLLEDLPSQSIFESTEEEDSDEQPQAVTTEEKPSVPVVAPVVNKSEVPDHSAALNEPVAIATNGSTEEHSFLEISNNKIISSSDGRVKKTKKNDLVFILAIISIVVIAVAISFALLNMKNANSLTQEQNKEDSTIVEQEKFQNNPFDKEEQESIVSQHTDVLEDQTINIVKNTMLKNKGKTVEEYFKSIFDDTYQTSWSSKPFTDKVYIVEFFASQVRSEPFVYLFRVDAEQQKITGALNNITLDLLG